VAQGVNFSKNHPTEKKSFLLVTGYIC
jgi:hypothetical protein